jgi:3-(3-hydroxy-phenyl)propionate hydroxylase
VRRLTSVIRDIGALIGERDPVKARARDARLLAEAGGTIVTIPRQELIPPLDTGCLSPLPHPANGTLFPQPLVREDAHSRRLDDLTGNGVRIVVNCALALDDQRIADLPGALDAAVVRLLRPEHAGAGVPQSSSPAASTPLEVVETEGVLAAWFAKHDCAAAVVRPDHYVYGVARDAAALAEQLRHLAQMLGLVLAPAPAPESAHTSTPTSSSNPTPERSTA